MVFRGKHLIVIVIFLAIQFDLSCCTPTIVSDGVNEHTIQVNEYFEYSVIFSSDYGSFSVQSYDVPEWMREEQTSGRVFFLEDIDQIYVYSVTCKEELCFVSFMDEDMIILNVSNPTEIKVVGMIEIEIAKDLYVMNNSILYASISNDIKYYDVSNLNSIQELGIVDTGASISKIVVVGDFMYCHAFGKGLIIVSIEQPYSPKVVGGSNPFPNGYWILKGLGVLNGGDRVVFGRFSTPNYGLIFVDSSNKTNVTFLKFVDSTTCFSERAMDIIQFNEDLIFVADLEYGFVVVDISNDLDSPFGVFSEEPDSSSDCEKIALNGEYSYLVGTDNTRGGLFVYDVTDPRSPVFLHEYFGYRGSGIDIMFKPGTNIGYYSSRAAILRIIDFSDVSSPVILGDFGHRDHYYDIVTGGGGGSSTPKKKRVYIANGGVGLKILEKVVEGRNVSYEEISLYPANFMEDECFRKVHVNEDETLAYVATGPTGVKILNITSPSSDVVLEGSYDTGVTLITSLYVMETQEQVVIIICGGSGDTQILNGTNSSQIEQMSSISASCNDLTVEEMEDGAVYLFILNSYYNVYDITGENIFSPVPIVTSHYLDEVYRKFVIEDALMYCIRDDTDFLGIFNITEISQPPEKLSDETGGVNPVDIVKVGYFLYLVDSSDSIPVSLIIVDVTDPTDPSISSTLTLPNGDVNNAAMSVHVDASENVLYMGLFRRPCNLECDEAYGYLAAMSLGRYDYFGIPSTCGDNQVRLEVSDGVYPDLEHNFTVSVVGCGGDDDDEDGDGGDGDGDGDPGVGDDKLDDDQKGDGGSSAAAWVVPLVLTLCFTNLCIVGCVFVCLALLALCCSGCIFLILSSMGVVGVAAVSKSVGKSDGFDSALKEGDLRDVNTGAKIKVKKRLYEIKFSNLEISKEIGDNKGGSNSNIFLCKWKNQDVVFKCFLTSSFRTQHDFTEFEREIEIMSSVRHQNCLKFYGCCLHPPRVGIVMEFCGMGDLKDYFTKNPEYPVASRMKMLEQVSDGMDYLHDRKVIHRDMKCENILLDSDLVPKIIDFGVSRIRSQIGVEMTKRVGTSYYMAPEVALGGDYSLSCDVYSFSVVIWEVLSNIFTSPFEGHELLNIEFRVAKDENFRPSVEKIPVDIRKKYPEVIKIMVQSWSAKPEERPTFVQLAAVFNDAVGMDDF